MRLFRRATPALLALVAIVLDRPVLAAAPGQAQTVAATRKVSFVAREGTWMSVDVSPDGRTLAFDLLGDIYLLPIEGGRARQLSHGPSWDREPRFSPRGDSVAIISDRGGMDNIWLLPLTGTAQPAQVSHETTDPVSSPAWTSDGRHVVARLRASLRSPNYQGPWALMRYAADGSARTLMYQAPARQPIGGGSAHPNGRLIYMSHIATAERTDGRTVMPFQVFELSGPDQALRPVTEGYEGAFRPQVSPDGRWLAFGRRSQGQTGLWIRDLTTQREQRLLERITHDELASRVMNDLLPGYGWSPDSASIVIARDGGLIRVAVETRAVTPIPFEVDVERELAPLVQAHRRVLDTPLEARVLRSHALDPRQRTLMFQAAGRIWLTPHPRGSIRPLTGEISVEAYDDAARLEYAPAWSPDGKHVAFATWTDHDAGNVVIRDIAAGSERVLTRSSGRYGNIAFSADGQQIVFVSEPAFAAPRALQGTQFEIRTFDLRTGEERLTTSFRQLRLMNPDKASWPRPFFSAAGDRIFFLEIRGHLDTCLVSVRTDGSDKRSHFAYEWADDAQLSPDGTQIAVVAQDDLYLHTPAVPATQAEASAPLQLAQLRRMTFEGATNPVWIDARTISWGSADRFHVRGIGESSKTRRRDIDLKLPRDRPQGVVAFTGARVLRLDRPDAIVLENATVLVDGNRIRSVGPPDSVRIPPHAQVFDVRGRTLIPGLVDMHAHPAVELEIFPRQHPSLMAALAFGVTTVLEPGVPAVPIFGASEMIETGQTAGPRVFSAGDPVRGYANGGNEWVTDSAVASRIVNRLVRYGATSLKSYGLPGRDQRQWLAELARRNNLHITAENTGDYHLAMTLAADGYSGIEHSIAQVPLYQDVVELLAASRIAYDPVLVAPRGGSGATSHFVRSIDKRLVAKVRAVSDARTLSEESPTRGGAAVASVFREQGAEAAKILRRGGRLVTGSHSAGLALHLDVWAYVEAGLTPAEALRAATIEPMRTLGFDTDLGSIESGKLADFLILDGNPLENIRHTADIRYVVKNGRVYDGNSADEVWPRQRTRPPFYFQSFERRGSGSATGR